VIHVYEIRTYPPVPIPREMDYFSLSPNLKVDQNRGLRAGRWPGEYLDFGPHFFDLNLGWQFRFFAAGLASTGGNPEEESFTEKEVVEFREIFAWPRGWPAEKLVMIEKEETNL